jgi:hypothetical protein
MNQKASQNSSSSAILYSTAEYPTFYVIAIDGKKSLPKMCGDLPVQKAIQLYHVLKNTAIGLSIFNSKVKV